MNKKKKFIKILIFLAILLLWMSLVFMFSKENGDDSSVTSKGITRGIVNLITSKNDITDIEKEQLVKEINPLIRKLAHYTLYLIGGILIISFFYIFDLSNKQKAIFSLLVGIAYAISDEVHQFFVADRDAKVTDVLIDTAGVITGILIFWLIINTIKYIYKKHKTKEVNN